ncbi:MAG TPA: ATP-grasp domain-containing protein [Planktothrix sp.]|jgi:hypothetical protein
MNSVFISPHFPPNFLQFSQQLKAAGAKVLGLADEPYDALSTDLKNSLTEYFRVNNMHNYDELVRALGYLTHKYGKIDHLDSHNEFWLETDARLRTDFNIPGIKLKDIDKIKRKSEMKRVFLQAGLQPARGRVCKTEEELRAFIKEVGYPVVAKPDVGVGAAKTFKIECETDIKPYLEEKLRVDYIVEEYVFGEIITFDGLTDKDGKLLFSSSLRYSRGVMEVVNENSDIYYYCVRDIEKPIEEAGLATLQAFDVRARFFHFEFFLNENGLAIPLEVNMRPPGGLTINMFNYMFDQDCYKTWAQMIVNCESKPMGPRQYFVIYVGRKDHIPYAMAHSQVLESYKSMMSHHERLNNVFSNALGNYGYVLRHPELQPLLDAAEAIQKRSA